MFNQNNKVMKKSIFLILSFLFVGIGMMFAQENGEIPEVPDVQYLVANFGTLMLTFTGIAGIASLLAELLIRMVQAVNKYVKIAFVLVVSVGLTFLSGLIFKDGDYALMIWWQKIAWGLLSGAAAAGLRGTNLLWVKSVVEFLIGLLLKKEPSE